MQSQCIACWMSWVLCAALVFVLLCAARASSDEPAKPVCRMIKKNSLRFCSMVDYVAVVDEDDAHGHIADEQATMYYDNVDVVLKRFGCHAKYSLYTCDHCREAYKYWICGIQFQKCGRTTVASTPETSQGPLLSQESSAQYFHAICSPPFPGDDHSKDLPCEEGVTGRHRTCLSICEDVVRKCPYILNFQCPTTETMYFSTDTSLCNKLDRSKSPDRPDQPWPGTFAAA